MTTLQKQSVELTLPRFVFKTIWLAMMILAGGTPAEVAESLQRLPGITLFSI